MSGKYTQISHDDKQKNLISEDCPRPPPGQCLREDGDARNGAEGARGKLRYDRLVAPEYQQYTSATNKCNGGRTI